MKVFISYSHNDITIKNEIKEILLELKNVGYIDEIWDDEEIRHGDEFDKKIFDNLVDSNIVLFIVTHNLWKSFYIPNIEIPLANNFFHKYGYPKIIPIVIEKEAFNETYFPTLNNKDTIPQKDKNLTSYNLLDKNEAKEIIKYNLINLIKTLPKREKIQIDFYKFNNLEKIKKLVIREKFKDLKNWIKTDNLVAYIEAEEGTGKTILATYFGNYLWENGHLVVFLNSKEWKNYTDFRELFYRYVNIELNYEFLKAYKKGIIFILDGVNEREKFSEVLSLLASYKREENSFKNQAIDFNVRLLFTTRELRNYGLQNEFKEFFKIELGQYLDNEFCEAVKLYYQNLQCEDFSENIKEMAKYPRYFELTIKLKDRLGNIQNITKELLYWEKLKWMIEKDDNFKKVLAIDSIDDIESKLCKFVDSIIEKDKIKQIFKKEYDDIKPAIKEGKIVIQEAGNKIEINKLLLKLSYALYLMTIAKELVLKTEYDFKSLSNDLQKYIEPDKSDIVGEIYFLILKMYCCDLNFANKDLILLTFFYMWINHQNSKVTNDKLKFIAKNLFAIYKKYLELLAKHKILHNLFFDFDMHLISILRDMWKNDSFEELEEYLYDLEYTEINENILNEINRKIAIISSNPNEIFLNNLNKLLEIDKENILFRKIWNNVRIVYDGKFLKNAKKLPQIKFIFNRSDLLEGRVMSPNHHENVFRIINSCNKKNIYDKSGIRYLGCLDEIIDEAEINKICNYVKSIDFFMLSEELTEEYIAFLANYKKNCLKDIYTQNVKKFYENKKIFLFSFTMDDSIDYSSFKHTNIVYINFKIAMNILQNKEKKFLIKRLIDSSFMSFLIDKPNIFNFFLINLSEEEQKYLEKLFGDNFIRKTKLAYWINLFKKFTNKEKINKDIFLFYLSLTKTNLYKNDVEKYLLDKINSEESPNIYFYLLDRNFDFKDYIFKIIKIDKNRPHSNISFGTTTKNRKIIDYLLDTNVANFKYLLIKNRGLFTNYSYKELKDIFGIKGIGFLLLDRNDDLLKWLEELKQNVSYFKIIDAKKPFERVVEINKNKFFEIFNMYFKKIKQDYKCYGKNFKFSNILDFELLEIMFFINKELSIKIFFGLIEIYGVYNSFSKFLFQEYDDENILLNFINYVKNDYDILTLTILFLRNNKKDILFSYLKENFLKSDNSFDRQIALSFIRWFGDEESLELIKNIWDNDKSGYVRYFAEFCYYVCLKEKKFIIKYKEVIQEKELEKFSIKLLAIRTCLSPVSIVTIENKYRQYKEIIDNFDNKQRYFFNSFIDKINSIFNDKFEIFGCQLKNHLAGEKIDKYKKIILDL